MAPGFTQAEGQLLRQQLLAGELHRDFKHLSVDMYLFTEKVSTQKKGQEEDEEEPEEGEEQRLLKVDMHFGKRKKLASLRTTCSHVEVRLYWTLSEMGLKELILIAGLTDRCRQAQKGFAFS